MMIDETEAIERAAIAINEMRKDLAVEFAPLLGEVLDKAAVKRVASTIGQKLLDVERAMDVEVVRHIAVEITLKGNTLMVDLIGSTKHGEALIDAAEKLMAAEK